MVNIENQELFAKAIADSLAAVNANDALNTWEKARCVNAIAKASQWLQASPFIDFDGEANTLLIWSAETSNNIYQIGPGNECSCEAWQHGNMCWHRAAKRLLDRYFALLLAQYARPAADHGDVPYLKNTTAKRELVGGLAI